MKRIIIHINCDGVKGCKHPISKDIVGVVEKKVYAIDHTPIYKIRVVRPVRAGMLLEFDLENNVIKKI